MCRPEKLTGRRSWSTDPQGQAALACRHGPPGCGGSTRRASASALRLCQEDLGAVDQAGRAIRV